MLLTLASALVAFVAGVALALSSALPAAAAGTPDLPTGAVVHPADMVNPRPMASGTASVGGRVWFDQNKDGIVNGSEKGLADVAVTVTYLGADGVLGGGDDVAVATVTDTAGAYVVQALAAGQYIVSVGASTLVGMTETYDPDGVATANQSSLSLGDGQTIGSIDFGYTGTGSIGGKVWFDANADRVLNPGEAGVAGVTVTATWPGRDDTWDTADDVTLRSTTAADGSYTFTDLPAGAYAVTADSATFPPRFGGGLPYLASRWLLYPTLTAGQVITNQDFGLLELADLSVSITQTSAPAPLGQPVSLRIVVTNLGPGIAPGFSLRDSVWNDFTYAPIPEWWCFEMDSPLSCSHSAFLAAGESAFLDVTVPAYWDTVANTVSGLSSSSPDPDQSNNQATVPLQMTLPSLSVGVTLVGDTLPPGSTGEFRIAVTKNSPGSLYRSAVMLDQELPAGAAVVSVTSDTWNCSILQQSVECVPKDDLQPFVTTTISVVVHVPAAPSGTAFLLRSWLTMLGRADPPPAFIAYAGTYTIGVLPDTGSVIGRPIVFSSGAVVVMGLVLLVAGRRRRATRR